MAPTMYHSSSPSYTFCTHIPDSSALAPTIVGSKLGFLDAQLARCDLVRHRRKPDVRLKPSRASSGLAQAIVDEKLKEVALTEDSSDQFKMLKRRFLSFKKEKYLKNLEHYQMLAEAQAPKFMVISCADSRVCPTSILGFEPGEAFVIRNVANLVPPCQNGPSETNAALEFAVNTLEVENLLIIGHSQCGGIRALMGLEDNLISSSFITSWVTVGTPAKLKTKSAAKDLDFDQQCKHCEKESISRSMMNLLTYPWIEERVKKGKLLIHGGYYDFMECSFEKWTLDYKGNCPKINVEEREIWT